MGANEFMIFAKGKTPKEAFRSARDEYAYLYGHGGYTGTIAEKSEFVMISLPAGLEPEEYAQKLLDSDDRRVSDKWGPAGCIRAGDEEFLFFGLASS